MTRTADSPRSGLWLPRSLRGTRAHTALSPSGWSRGLRARLAEESLDGVDVAGEQLAVGQFSVPEAEGVGVQHVERPAVVFGRHPGGEHHGVAVAQDALRLDGDGVAALLAEPLEGADHLVEAVELARDGRPSGDAVDDVGRDTLTERAEVAAVEGCQDVEESVHAAHPRRGTV